MANIKFNYTQKEYQDKVDFLKERVNKLRTILGDLETKKNQIKDFWNDPQALKYTLAINKNINACKTAIFNTNLTIKQLESVIDDMEKTATSMEEKTSKTDTLVSKLEQIEDI